MNYENKAYLIIGGPGTGKTRFTKYSVNAYGRANMDERLIVLDPQRTFARDTPKLLRRVEFEYPRHTSRPDLDKYKNCLLVIDDCRILYSSSYGQELVNLCIDKRHRNLNIMMIYHGFSQVHPALWSVVDVVYCFRCTESYSRIKKKDPPEIFDRILYKKIQNLEIYKKIRINLS